MFKKGKLVYIGILFFLVILFILYNVNKKYSFNVVSENLNSFNYSNNDLKNNINLSEKVINFKYDKIDINLEFHDGIIAYLSIPAINLYNVPIVEGVSEEVLSKAIGHFEMTGIDSGNVGLAAHNRSNTVCYFKNLKLLNNGDKIFIKTKNGTNIYEVRFSTIIDSYDWTYLQNEDISMVTCITCIDNIKDKRLCIRAYNIKEEK